MEKSRNSQVVYAVRTNLSKQTNWPRSKTTSNVLVFKYQRAGKTNLFHMRGGRIHVFNTWCTFKAKMASLPLFTHHQRSMITRLKWIGLAGYSSDWFVDVYLCLPRLVTTVVTRLKLSTNPPGEQVPFNYGRINNAYILPKYIFDCWNLSVCNKTFPFCPCVRRGPVGGLKVDHIAMAWEGKFGVCKQEDLTNTSEGVSNIC